MLGFLIKNERISQNISQAQLCQYICTPSYLSKIENETVVCDQEIYNMLLSALHIDFVSDDASHARFAGIYSSIVCQLQEQGSVTNSYAQHGQFCQDMRYSSYCVEASLVCLLLDMQQQNYSGYKILPLIAPYVNDDNTQLYHHVKSAYEYKCTQASDSIKTLEQIKYLGEAWIYLALAKYYLYNGDCKVGISHAEQAYALYSQSGRVYGMINCAFVLVTISFSSDDYSKVLEWSQVIANINKVVQLPQIDNVNNYNIGATYLTNSTPQLSLQYLAKFDFAINEQGTMYSVLDELVHQKLSLAYVFVADKVNARKHLTAIGDSNNKGIVCSQTLIDYMLEDDNYLLSPYYCTLLEQCIEQSQVDNSYNISKFYARYLLQAYKAQRQYKKATTLLEQFPV